MKGEPVAGQLTDLLKHPRLLKEMIGSWQECQLRAAAQRPNRLLIEVDDHMVFTTDNQQRG